MPELPTFFSGNPQFVQYFRDVHADGALDAKTKELIHLALVLAYHCEP